MSGLPLFFAGVWRRLKVWWCDPPTNLTPPPRPPSPPPPPPRPPYAIKTRTHSRCCFGVCRDIKNWKASFPHWKANFQQHQVKRILISYNNNSIRTIQFFLQTTNGPDLIKEPITPQAEYGEHFKEINMEDNEIITGISGRLSYWSKTLKCIAFITNKPRKIGPYGGKKDHGYPFSYEFLDGIRGLYGTYDKTGIITIGVIMNEEADVQPTDGVNNGGANASNGVNNGGANASNGVNNGCCKCFEWCKCF